MSERDLTELEQALALMRSLGRTHMPISLDAVERMIAVERRRRQKAA